MVVSADPLGPIPESQNYPSVGVLYIMVIYAEFPNLGIDLKIISGFPNMI